MLWKASNLQDVQRFRRWFGSGIGGSEADFGDPGGGGQSFSPLTITFLGEGLEGIDAPVLKSLLLSHLPGANAGRKVNWNYLDVATGAVVLVADPFVEALPHDSVVVQINRLKDRRRTELERLLAVFDQGLASHSGRPLLDVPVENFPERHEAVLDRLLRAGAEPKILQGMDLEDEIIAAFKWQARRSADLRQALEEKDQLLEEKDKLLEEKCKLLEERDRHVVELKGRAGHA